MNGRVGAPISRAREFQEGEDGGVDADAEGERWMARHRLARRYEIANDEASPLKCAPSIPSNTSALNACRAFE
jgi:hypothetical protein